VIAPLFLKIILHDFVENKKLIQTGRNPTRKEPT
jgi:hypothetical protein